MTTLFLEIIHPNNVVDGFWREVERPSSLEDAMDHLSSPTFEWSIGTCVRVHDGTNILYSGIYNHTECVDVGADSECVRRFQWTNGFRKGSLFERWHTCSNATVMLESVAPVISKQTMARAAVACIRVNPNFENSDLNIKRLATQIEKWSNSDCSIHQLQYTADWAQSSIGWLAPVITPVTWVSRDDYNRIVSSTPTKLSTSDYVNRQLQMSYAIRKSVPFYEIAVGYVTTD